ncbi:MAG: CxxxxCH/CxxCH domain-containing protein [Nitrospirae bacterium]|nr:CxxxxCH/CxxCH domain-containing protein [Nitrospirota bacterium]
MNNKTRSHMHYALRLISLFFMFSMVVCTMWYGFAGAACTYNAPSVYFTPTAGVVGTSTSRTYAVTVVNNDTGDTCGTSTFTVSITSDTGGTGITSSLTAGTTTDALSIGQRYNSTLTITTTSDAVGIRTNVVEASDTTNHSGSKAGRGSVQTKVSNDKGDARLLIRAEEELCHSCHKTDRNTYPSSPAWDKAIKTHNSRLLNSAYWGSLWGVAGGKYGEIVCTTCHTSHDTRNIFLIKERIETPDGTSNWGSTGSRWATIDFRWKSGIAWATGMMGWNSDAPRSTSTRICEACHLAVSKHTHNQQSTDTGSHTNSGKDCTECHYHTKSFAKGAGSQACNSCHGAPPGAYGDPDSSSFSVSHLKHYSTVAALATSYNAATVRSTLGLYVFDCGLCHSTDEGADHKMQAQGWNTVTVNLNASGINGWFTRGTTWYTNTPPPGEAVDNYMSTDSKCGNFCHGNFIGGNNMTLTWGSANTAGCGTCHGYTKTAWPTGPSHGSHISTVIGQGLSCDKCHKDTVATGFDTITRYDIHVNIKADWRLDRGDTRFGSIATYGGAESGSDNVGTYDKCDNLYCHSSGQANWGTLVGITYASPTWSSAVTAECGTCHPASGGGVAGWITTGSHDKHVQGSNHPCRYCHMGAIGSNANHTNRNIEVSMWTTYGGSYSQPFATNPPGDGYGYCRNVYCHGAATPSWGGAAIACDGCHSSNNTLQGEHAVHYATATLPTNKDPWTNSTAGAYVYGCGVCHTPIDHGGGVVTAYQAAEVKFDATFAGGGSYKAQTSIAGTDMGFNWTAGWNTNACTSTYCHSPGTANTGAGLPNVQAFTWQTFAALNCSGCHRAWPGTGQSTIATGSHLLHVVSIGCQVCHNTTTSNGTSITDKAKHVDRLVNVGFDSSAVLDLTGQYNSVSSPMSKTPGSAYGSCANIYCHSGQNNGATANSYDTPAWNTAVTGNCAGGACHGGGVGNASSKWLTTGTHFLHISTINGNAYACDVCHSGAGKPTAKHLDKRIDVAFSTTYGGSYSQEATWHTPANGYGSCALTACHGGYGTYNVPWGTTGSDSVTCTKCHGNPTTTWNTANYYKAAPGADGVGKDTAGETGTYNDNVSTDRQVGAHNSHLLTISTISLPIKCTECHVSPWTSTNSPGHIDTQTPAELTFGTIANIRYSINTVAKYDPATGKCDNVYCHDAALFKNHYGSGLDPVWYSGGYISLPYNTLTTCTNKCHGFPPPSGHDAGTNCKTCHGTGQGNVNASNDGFTTVNQHLDGQSQGSGGDCNSGCHGSVQGFRRPILGEFNWSSSGGWTTWWGHKRAVWGSVTKYDCGVCHMEGNALTGEASTTYHANGKLDLRDPDTGEPIQWVSFSNSANTYSPTGVISTIVRFSRDTASSTLEPEVLAIQINFCLKCHDADGALSTLARVGGDTTNKLTPFNNAGTVVNVRSMFWQSNASKHPILARGHNSYVWRSNMQEPWTSYVKSRPSTTEFGHLITCWDCHNDDPVIPWTTSRSVTAHGNIISLRKPANWANEPTALCVVCHKSTVYYNGTVLSDTQNLTAFDLSTTDSGHSNAAGGKHKPTSTGFYGCRSCHSSKWAATISDPSTRSLRGEDAHGFDWLTIGGGLWPATGGSATQPKPFAFVRSTKDITQWRPKSWPGESTGEDGGYCRGTGSPNIMCGKSYGGSYTPGGAF